MSKRFERFVKGSAFIERCNGNIPYSEIISRLSKLEDIMEENDCLTPEELKEKIESLAEKDKEIEELKLDNKKYFTDSCRANKEIAYKLKQQNQKALEQLEKVREKFGYKHNSQLFISSKNLVEFINQQIALLKGE